MKSDSFSFKSSKCDSQLNFFFPFFKNPLLICTFSLVVRVTLKWKERCDMKVMEPVKRETRDTFNMCSFSNFISISLLITVIRSAMPKMQEKDFKISERFLTIKYLWPAIQSYCAVCRKTGLFWVTMRINWQPKPTEATTTTKSPLELI